MISKMGGGKAGRLPVYNFQCKVWTSLTGMNHEMLCERYSGLESPAAEVAREPVGVRVFHSYVVSKENFCSKFVFQSPVKCKYKNLIQIRVTHSDREY